MTSCSSIIILIKPLNESFPGVLWYCTVNRSNNTARNILFIFRFGRAKGYKLTHPFFFLVSLACAFSPNITIYLVLRILYATACMTYSITFTAYSEYLQAKPLNWN